MKKRKTAFFVILWSIIGAIYSPIYLTAWVLKLIAKLLLSISYFGTLNATYGKGVFKSIFKFS